ncbi:hypothetical protein ASC97_07250 [Rhizobium sp. Root1203]|uniref:hypothetical protein n=1 Tax=Rhizobium sp. Root1203 TaxID=1736427 RepID=UPI00070D72CB|nr:hypothetical protein [Rhizobium sp. Root1203]KQV28136.1 hypothetical protein ASC97_07250 [Rhizobium sp. Root1203]
MQHARDIATEQSKRDLRWCEAHTLAACDQYMAIEAQRSGAIGFAHVRKPENAIRGENWLYGAMSVVEGHYRYAREIMGIADADQLYA